MAKYKIVPEISSFGDDSFTERGEKVYKSLKITLCYPNEGGTIERVIQAEEGVGFTQEWIEETIQGCFDKLQKDFPWDHFELIRIKPNELIFTTNKGLVN